HEEQKPEHEGEVVGAQQDVLDAEHEVLAGRAQRRARARRGERAAELDARRLPRDDEALLATTVPGDAPEDTIAGLGEPREHERPHEPLAPTVDEPREHAAVLGKLWAHRDRAGEGRRGRRPPHREHPRRPLFERERSRRELVRPARGDNENDERERNEREQGAAHRNASTMVYCEASFSSTASLVSPLFAI